MYFVQVKCLVITLENKSKHPFTMTGQLKPLGSLRLKNQTSVWVATEP